MINKDEFSQWRDNPITQAVMKRVQSIAEEAKQKWIEASWDQGAVDPVLRADLYSRAEIANDLVNMTFEDLETDEERKRDKSS